VADIRCGNCGQLHHSVEIVKSCYQDHPERAKWRARELASAEIPDGFYRVAGPSGRAKSFEIRTVGTGDTTYQQVWDLSRREPLRVYQPAGIIQIRALIATDLAAARDAFEQHQVAKAIQRP
jgi:hypothetical protein